MVHNPLSLGYVDLKTVVRQAYKRLRRSIDVQSYKHRLYELRTAFREMRRRSRHWHYSHRNWIHRKLLEACMDYANKGFRIANAIIIARLRVALKELRVKNRRLSIFLDRETSAFRRIQIRNRDLTSDQTLSIHFNQTTLCQQACSVWVR
jgi:hypothetical protein